MWMMSFFVIVPLLALAIVGAFAFRQRHSAKKIQWLGMDRVQLFCAYAAAFLAFLLQLGFIVSSDEGWVGARNLTNLASSLIILFAVQLPFAASFVTLIVLPIYVLVRRHLGWSMLSFWIIAGVLALVAISAMAFANDDWSCHRDRMACVVQGLKGMGLSALLLISGFALGARLTANRT